MTKTVTATCTVSFSVGESFETGGKNVVLAYAGDVLVVVQEHSTHLTVRKSGNDATFAVYPGQYR